MTNPIREQFRQLRIDATKAGGENAYGEIAGRRFYAYRALYARKGEPASVIVCNGSRDAAGLLRASTAFNLALAAEARAGLTRGHDRAEAIESHGYWLNRTRETRAELTALTA